MTLTKLTLGIMSGGLTALSLQAGINPGFAGNTETAQWYDLNRSNPLLSEANGYNHNYQTPNVGWAQPLADMTGTTSAGLDKVAGTDLYVAGGGLFSFSAPGVLFVEDTAPLAGVQTILIQLETEYVMGGPESFVFEPTLYLNGEATALVADFSSSLTGSGVNYNETSTLFFYQWDLSGLASPVDEFKIEWSTGDYYYNLDMELNTTDVAYNGLTVPEPQTYALFAGLGAICVAVIRRRKQP